MGVLGLWQLLAPVGQPVSLESLENKIFAVDISIWLNQALKGYRDSQGGSVANAHLMSLFTRLCKLMFYRIRPIIVFDGAVPELKKQTVTNRQHRRDIMKQNSRHAGVKRLASYMVSQMLKSKNKTLKKGLTNVTLQRSKAPNDEIFLLPPLPVESTPDEFIKTEPELKPDMLTKDEVEYLSKIDIESDEFTSLPADIKLEILSTLKENRRHRTWEEYENLPDDSHDFSSYQLNALLKRRNLQKKVEEVKIEMQKTNTADIMSLYDTDDVVETSKIMSEDSAHYVLLKKAAKKADHKPGIATGNSFPFNEGEKTVCEQNDDTDVSVDNLDHYSDIDVHSEPEDFVSEPEDIFSSSKSNIDDLCDKTVANNLSFSKNNNSESSEVDLENNVIAGIHKNKVILSKKSNTANEELPECGRGQNPDSSVAFCSGVTTVKPQFSRRLSFDEKPGSKTQPEEIQDKLSEYLSEVEDDDASFKEQIEIGIITADSVRPSQPQVPQSHILPAMDADLSFQKEIEIGPATADSVKPLQPEVPSSHVLSTIPSETPQHITVDIRERSDDPVGSDMKELICSDNAQHISDEVCIAMQDELAASQAALAAEEAKQQRQANTVQEHMYEECQELLRLFGVPYIISPTEAEAQCAFLDSENVTHGTITDDSDIWLFGGKRVCKNFFSQNKFVECYKDKEIFSHFGLTRNKLINFALLTGSDYTEGIEGVGPVTAMEILSEFNADGIEAMCAFKEWWDLSQKHSSPPKNKVRAKLQKLSLSAGFPSSKVYEAYLNPVVDKSTESFTWGRPDLDALRDYTKEKFGWSKDKVDDNLLPVIKRLNERTAQAHLDSYFTISLKKEKNLFPSKRIMSALKKMQPVAKESNSKNEPEPQKKKVKISRKKVEKTKKQTKVSEGRRSKRQNLSKEVVSDTVRLSEESSSDSM